MTLKPDMLCSAIASAPASTLKPATTVGEALKKLNEDRVLAIPVVDEGGRYLGMFGKRRLIAALLPKVLSVKVHGVEIGETAHLGFITETLSDIHERLAAIAGEPVEKHMDTDVTLLRPETPLTHALFILHKHRNFLPVVGHDGRLAGVISTWDVFEKIGGTR